MPNTDIEKSEELMKIIKQFYAFANVPPPNNLVVNEYVAEVFGIMLKETADCSKAMNWIPIPPRGKANIVWLVTNFGKGAFNRKKAKLHRRCAGEAIRKWRSPLKLASMGLALRQEMRPIWA